MKNWTMWMLLALVAGAVLAGCSQPAAEGGTEGATGTTTEGGATPDAGATTESATEKPAGEGERSAY